MSVSTSLPRSGGLQITPITTAPIKRPSSFSIAALIGKDVTTPAREGGVGGGLEGGGLGGSPTRRPIAGRQGGTPPQVVRNIWNSNGDNSNSRVIESTNGISRDNSNRCSTDSSNKSSSNSSNNKVKSSTRSSNRDNNSSNRGNIKCNVSDNNNGNNKRGNVNQPLVVQTQSPDNALTIYSNSFVKSESLENQRNRSEIRPVRGEPSGEVIVDRNRSPLLRRHRRPEGKNLMEERCDRRGVEIVRGEGGGENIRPQGGSPAANSRNKSPLDTARRRCDGDISRGDLSADNSPAFAAEFAASAFADRSPTSGVSRGCVVPLRGAAQPPSGFDEIRRVAAIRDNIILQQQELQQHHHQQQQQQQQLQQQQLRENRRSPLLLNHPMLHHSQQFYNHHIHQDLVPPGTLPGILRYSDGRVGMPAPHPPVGPPHPADSAAPFYTWLLARHAGASYLNQRYLHHGGGGGMLFPFRKPKRIRTAFSPAQLLQLEEAFIKNHYVVGQERKTLASSLNLSETQVKVWFQNRRTKHKRVQTDDEGSENEEDEEGGGEEGERVVKRARINRDDLSPYSQDYDSEDVDVDSIPSPSPHTTTFSPTTPTLCPSARTLSPTTPTISPSARTLSSSASFHAVSSTTPRTVLTLSSHTTTLSSTTPTLCPSAPTLSPTTPSFSPSTRTASSASTHALSSTTPQATPRTVESPRRGENIDGVMERGEELTLQNDDDADDEDEHEEAEEGRGAEEMRKEAGRCVSDNFRKEEWSEWLSESRNHSRDYVNKGGSMSVGPASSAYFDERHRRQTGQIEIHQQRRPQDNLALSSSSSIFCRAIGTADERDFYDKDDNCY